MHIGADVFLLLNDGHGELEDDDHDVIDVISPLSFKVEMNNLMVSSMMLKDLMMVMRMTKMMVPLVGDIVFDAPVDGL